MMSTSGVTLHSPNGFGQPKCVCGQAKFPKYVCLVVQLGKQLLKKANFKNYSRYSLIKWYQFLSI